MATVSVASATGQEQPPAAEPHLRDVLESLPVAIVRFDEAGTLLAVNQQALAILGARSLDQVLGSSILHVVAEDEREGCNSLIAQAIKGEACALEVDLVGLTGNRQTIELRAVAYPVAPDGIRSAVVALRDVTDGRRLAQSLVEAVAVQNEQNVAHAAERSQLLADLELARQQDKATSGSQLADVERRLVEAKDERTALETAHAEELARLRETMADEQRRSAAEVTALNLRLEALERTAAERDTANALRLQEVEAAGAARLTEAEEAIARTTARAEAAEAAVERTRTELETVAQTTREELLKAIGQLAQDAGREAETRRTQQTPEDEPSETQEPSEETPGGFAVVNARGAVISVTR